METRAKFILIGAFTIAGFIGILAFFLMFVRIELDRQFDYYDIRFSSVSGLGNASDVRFSGLPVGQVVDVRLSPEQDGLILVRVEVDGDTPVRIDSVATIEAQGVTGVSFVNIGPGTLSKPLLNGTDDDLIPEIKAGRSTLQSLSEDAPKLVNETLEAVQQVRDLLGGDNQERLERILINIEGASENFAKTLKDFSAVTETVSTFAEQVGRFNSTLETLSQDLSNTLETADETLVSIGELSDNAKTVVARGSETLEQTKSYIEDELTGTTNDVRQTLESLREQIAVLSEDAQTLMDTLGQTGTTATARLDEARETLQAVNKVVAQLGDAAEVVGTTATSIGNLIESEAEPLVTETRALVASTQQAITTVNEVAETDLPAIIADIRSATETSSEVIADVGENLKTASGRIEGISEQAGATLGEATTAFRNANETLAAINEAMETGDSALAAAERAFSGADRVINEEISGVTSGLEKTLKTLNAAVAEVSEDLPKISEDLRSASQSASDAFEALRKLSASSAPDVQKFTKTALPLYTRLAAETRTLIANIDRLTKQIERDPARFFLSPETPTFRR